MSNQKSDIRASTLSERDKAKAELRSLRCDLATLENSPIVMDEESYRYDERVIREKISQARLRLNRSIRNLETSSTLSKAELYSLECDLVTLENSPIVMDEQSYSDDERGILEKIAKVRHSSV